MVCYLLSVDLVKHIKSGSSWLNVILDIRSGFASIRVNQTYYKSNTRFNGKVFIWQVLVKWYNRSGKKHIIKKLYKYSQETEPRVHEYRYQQSHLEGHAVSRVDHR